MSKRKTITPGPKAKKNKKRYFGTVIIKRGAKMCWVSRHDKNGWSLGLAMGSRTQWLTGLRFKDTDEIKRVLSLNIAFVHMKSDGEDIE